MIRFLFRLWHEYELAHDRGPLPQQSCPDCRGWGEEVFGTLITRSDSDLLDEYWCRSGHLFFHPRWANWPSYRCESRFLYWRIDLMLKLRSRLHHLSAFITGKDA